MAETVWVPVVTLPPRLMIAWLETHLRLVETASAVAGHRLREAEQTVAASLELCAKLAAEPDPARRVELQAAGAQAMVNRAFAAAQARYELVKNLQLETIELLRRRAGATIAEVAPAATPDNAG